MFIRPVVSEILGGDGSWFEGGTAPLIVKNFVKNTANAINMIFYKCYEILLDNF